MQLENETSNGEEPYHVKYYRENKPTISELRKIKYHTDPKYREKAKKRARDRYRKKLRSPDKKLGYTIKYIDGVAVYSVKYVLGVISKSRDFLDVWEENGRIPKSTYLDNRGWRLYTQHQINILDTAIGKYDSGEWTREEVAAYLHAHWEG
jgi:hypothetical protein